MHVLKVLDVSVGGFGGGLHEAETGSALLGNPGSAVEGEVRPPNMYGFRFHVWPPKVVWPATYKGPSVG